MGLTGNIKQWIEITDAKSLERKQGQANDLAKVMGAQEEDIV